MQTSYLPNELACRLIQLEVGMQEESGLSREGVLELLDCYTRAVEHYNQKGDDRRNAYFQRKMQDFLQRPATIQVLEQGKKSELTLRREKNEEEMRKASNQSQQMVKQLVEHSQEESRKQKIFVQADLAKQEKTLEERLLRKRANSSRGGRPRITSASFGCSNSKKQVNETFVDVLPPSKKDQE